MKTCPKCGKRMSDKSAFCQNCGTSITAASEEQTETESTEKKKPPKKKLAFSGICVVIVAVLILAAYFIFSGGKSENIYAVYVKDSELFVNNLKKNSKSWQLSSRLDDTDSVDAYSGDDIATYVYISEDGKYIYFPDKLQDDGDYFSLYYKEVAKPNAEAIKIDSNVADYTVNTPATIVTYLKGNEGGLYQYNIKDGSKNKIASGVYSYNASDDGSKIIYKDSENSVYIKSADKDKEKIASNVSYIEQITEDFTTVYYIKDRSLYKQVIGEDKEKIASDVGFVIKIYDSGEVYYWTYETEEIALMDYVIDDMKDNDAKITEPDSPDYPSEPSRPKSSEYGTQDEYNAAYAAYEESHKAWKDECNNIKSEYNAAREAYSEKKSRDELRTKLEENTIEQDKYSLCFFNGTKNVVITDMYSSNWVYATDVPVICYEARVEPEIAELRLSEIKSISTVQNMVEALTYETERYIAVKDASTLVEQEDQAVLFRINDSGTTVYYIDDIAEGNDYGDLYSISISGGVVGEPELYDSDVYAGNYGFINDTELEYYKEHNNNGGELYINKNKIDDDVIYYIDNEAGNIFYITDWNSNKDCGTLKVYNGQETISISEDVSDLRIASDGRVLYLKDYSFKYYQGELYEWLDGESIKIDDDVTCLISFLT